MKEMQEYRTRLIDRLDEAAQEFIEACKAREPFANVAGSDWNVHQSAAHMRDVDKFVYGERIRKTLNEDNPLIRNFDADKWMEAHYNKEESLDVILNEFLKSVSNLCRMLRDLPDEAWSREITHEFSGSGLTLQLWVERSLSHIEEHLANLAR